MEFSPFTLTVNDSRHNAARQTPETGMMNKTAVQKMKLIGHQNICSSQFERLSVRETNW